MWKLREVKASAGGEAQKIFIFGDIAPEGDLEDGYSAERFRAALEGMNPALPLEVHVNSLGGAVAEGLAIYNLLKQYRGRTTVYIDGFACSIASVIAMAGDEVVMPRTAMLMIHNAWMLTAGNFNELRKDADDLEQINNALIEAYLEKAGEKLDRARLQVLLNEETFLTADEALELGLIDRIDRDTEADASVLELAAARSVKPGTVAAKLEDIRAALQLIRAEQGRGEQAPPEERIEQEVAEEAVTETAAETEPTAACEDKAPEDGLENVMALFIKALNKEVHND